MSDWAERTQGGRSFTGSDIQIVRAITLASALDLYAKTGMRASRLHTPARMLQVATEITGIPFKRRQYVEAATVLRTWANAAKGAPRHSSITQRDECPECGGLPCRC